VRESRQIEGAHARRNCPCPSRSRASLSHSSSGNLAGRQHFRRDIRHRSHRPACDFLARAAASPGPVKQKLRPAQATKQPQDENQSLQTPPIQSVPALPLACRSGAFAKDDSRTQSITSAIQRTMAFTALPIALAHGPQGLDQTVHEGGRKCPSRWSRPLVSRAANAQLNSRRLRTCSMEWSRSGQNFGVRSSEFGVRNFRRSWVRPHRPSDAAGNDETPHSSIGWRYPFRMVGTSARCDVRRRVQRWRFFDWGYSRLSLRDSKTAALQGRQSAPGVQRFD